MGFEKSKIKIKTRAAGIHLSFSLVIFVFLVYQIYFNWYPVPYFSVDGGWQGIRLIAAVDLVLGPLITFVIFDLSKQRKEIVFDLLIIATIQIGALIYGIHTTYTQRPVAIVLIDDFVVGALQSDYGAQRIPLSELAKYSDQVPPIIFADMPYDKELLKKVSKIKFEDKIPEYAQTHLYQPQSKLVAGLEDKQQNFFTQLDLSRNRAGFDSWLLKNNRTPADVLIAPFRGRYGSIWLIFDQQGRYLDYF